MAVQVGRRRFTVDDYYKMAEAGILSPSDRVELIDGEVIQVSPIGSPHAAAVDRTNKLLIRKLGDGAVVRVQNPLRIDEYNEPEPDFVVARTRTHGYEDGHPAPQDVMLLIEVSDTTLRFDRRVKLPLYASAGIPEVWIANLVGTGRGPRGSERVLEVHRRPGSGGYEEVRVLRRGDRIAPAQFPEMEIDAAEIIGGA